MKDILYVSVYIAASSQGTVNIIMRTLNKEQMKTTDTPELLTPPFTHTATCTAHTHASGSVCNITLDFSASTE